VAMLARLSPTNQASWKRSKDKKDKKALAGQECASVEAEKFIYFSIFLFINLWALPLPPKTQTMQMVLKFYWLF